MKTSYSWILCGFKGNGTLCFCNLSCLNTAKCHNIYFWIHSRNFSVPSQLLAKQDFVSKNITHLKFAKIRSFSCFAFSIQQHLLLMWIFFKPKETYKMFLCMCIETCAQCFYVYFLFLMHIAFYCLCNLSKDRYCRWLWKVQGLIKTVHQT